MKIIFQELYSLFATQKKDLKVPVLTKMHGGKNRTKIISKCVSLLKIYFDPAAYLYYFTLQVVHVNLEHVTSI